MSPVSSSMSPVSSSMSPDFMLSDPFIYKLSQMCLKDPIVQSLYHNRIMWSDIPSDDDALELDDWESYNKIQKYAKESYQHVYQSRQKHEIARTTIKKSNKCNNRIPYITLKQNRFRTLQCDSPISSTIHDNTPPITTTEVPTEIIKTDITDAITNSHMETPIEEIIITESPAIENIKWQPLEEIPLEIISKKMKNYTKKSNLYEKKHKDKVKPASKNIINTIPYHNVPRKKRFSFCTFFLNCAIFSFVISMSMAITLVFV